jgi:hypothetical protein
VLEIIQVVFGCCDLRLEQRVAGHARVERHVVFQRDTVMQVDMWQIRVSTEVLLVILKSFLDVIAGEKVSA